MRHHPALLLLTLCVAACADAEGSVTDNASPPADALQAGWAVRYDDPDDVPAPNETRGQATPPRFLRRDDGLEVTPGPNCSIWHEDLAANGDFRITLDVTHLDSGIHAHGAGLTFGGSDVHGEEQRYTYFLVRGDRHFLIKTRNGDDTAEIVNWTEHDAVAPEDENGVTRNVLEVERSGDEVRFLINHKQVHLCGASQVPTDGRLGVRLVHDLRVRFRGPKLERR